MVLASCMVGEGGLPMKLQALAIFLVVGLLVTLAAAPEEAAPPESDSDGASSPQSKPIPNQELVSRTDAEATLVDRARTLGDRDHQIA